MKRRVSHSDLTGAPEEYFRRIAAFRVGCRKMAVLLLALTAIMAALIAWFTQSDTPATQGPGGLLVCAVGAAILLFTWVGFIASVLDSLHVKPRIVPYFQRSVPGPDTFFRGEALARNCRYLDDLAADTGGKAVSDFGFADDFYDGTARWFPASAGLAVFQNLERRLKEDPAPVSDSEQVIEELARINAKLREAERLQVEFCLHLRTDSGYTGHEFDSRKGRYWE